MCAGLNMTDRAQPATGDDRISKCEAVLQYRFRDPELLKRCLTHASASRTRLASNERLEFLGDAVLGLVVCDMLYARFPESPEGELTRLKSDLVSRNTCADITERLGLERFLLMGKGVTTHAHIPRSILAAVMEALIAGVYLDGGMPAAYELIERWMTPEIERGEDSEHRKNAKSLLQQVAQKRFGETPFYRLLDEKGPDHSKCFHVAAVIGARAFTGAWGPTKKEAEQNAARHALDEIQGSSDSTVAQ